MKNCPICRKPIVDGEDMLVVEYLPVQQYWITRHFRRIDLCKSTTYHNERRVGNIIYSLFCSADINKVF
jgi:hypothetical protein